MKNIVLLALISAFLMKRVLVFAFKATTTALPSRFGCHLISTSLRIPSHSDRYKLNKLNTYHYATKIEDIAGIGNGDDNVLADASDAAAGAGYDPENLKRRQQKAFNPKKLKVRQHVNPLAAHFQVPIELSEDWMYAAFSDPTSTGTSTSSGTESSTTVSVDQTNTTEDGRIAATNYHPILVKPMVVDVGCARGTWALKMAEANPNSLNILGLEIRRPMVEYCLYRKHKRALHNVHFMPVNANVDLENILRSLLDQGVTISAITIQFPDPHFKAKHKKRRVVNTSFVQSLAKLLPPSTQVFVQSDIEELTIDMVSHLSAPGSGFSGVQGYCLEQLSLNPSPFPFQTEREIATLANNGPVYRMLFYRNNDTV
mmetsp:Transcript_7853/g.13010  ORF Transcript_7853/g.13010 Transcript_7853/m.13010 type:complete len:371 (-) Transcript_7853:270-1382(-)|eukprot:CAMPEP_0174962882 /NCGR_PEP_ID=MMETSP0004_2-20121128/5018_1 /TAXON_ID=420556 /ORGANISM="Ochromonas sp., Strain CCMP1393" /LENGTH=370 /DNA_ID=CAMNT_0016211439 /DNA_START=49 /DNA_END=1161 /DNA_ORIENTATION=-